MALKGSDREFRLEKLSYIDFKPLNMDRVLTMLFPRLRFLGYGTRRPPRQKRAHDRRLCQRVCQRSERVRGIRCLS